MARFFGEWKRCHSLFWAKMSSSDCNFFMAQFFVIEFVSGFCYVCQAKDEQFQLRRVRLIMALPEGLRMKYFDLKLIKVLI